MSKTRFITLIACLFLLAPTATGKDPGFDAFWVKFCDALKRNDKEAIASMTKLPYLWNDKKLNKQEFIAKYNQLFDKKTRDCLVKQKPVQDTTYYSAFCGEEIFMFQKIKNTYMFTEIGVND
ncbi:MAG: hypothetical protein IT343_13950 [Candidatus Melainabacteria bacterium]|jgi:hypothetical protein|nr:hypothetical protein [Candidatus Melainabacteria bacterium]